MMIGTPYTNILPDPNSRVGNEGMSGESEGASRGIRYDRAPVSRWLV